MVANVGHAIDERVLSTYDGSLVRGCHFFFQAEDGIRDVAVTGVQTCALPIWKIAKQANGAITARYGDTVLLTTACMASAMNDRDFLPLTVDYRENTYSAGKIPGGFLDRKSVV